MIADYDGTVLIVSHDRDFLDRTVTITLGLDGSGRVDVVAGGYADWDRIRKERLQGRPVARTSTAAPAAAPPPPPPPRKGKLSYKDQRDYELLPQRIEDIDRLIARGETDLADPALYTRDPERFAKLTETLDTLRAEKESAEMRWLELAELVEG